MKNVFISPDKLFSFLGYLNLCHDFFGTVGKPLAKKAKANFIIYDVIN